MAKLALQKISYVVLMLFIISIISFGAIHLAPNSFFASGELNPNITPEAIEQLKRVYGLDKSLSMQFLSWANALIHFDFGISFASGKMVKDEILSRISITLIMNIVSMILVFVISIYFGIKSAFKQNTKYDTISKNFSLVSYAMPSFYLALLLVMVFAVKYKIFPISGLHSPFKTEGFAYILDEAWHLVLPIFVMVFGGVGSLIMYVRSLSINILKSDYIFYAKTRGVSKITLSGLPRSILEIFVAKSLAPYCDYTGTFSSWTYRWKCDFGIYFFYQWYGFIVLSKCIKQRLSSHHGYLDNFCFLDTSWQYYS